MNRTLQSAVTILLILGIGLPLWKFVIARVEPPPQAPPLDLGPVPVSTVTIELGDFEIELDAYGNLRPARRVPLASELAGRVVQVHPGWHPGAQVAEGDLLVALDEEPFALELFGTKARAAEAAAAVEVAQVDLRLLQRELDKAVAQLAIAERDLKRQKQLLTDGVSAEAAVDRAQSAVLDAELFEERSRTGHDAAAASVKVAEARRDAADGAVAQAEDRLGRCKLTAPFAGRLRDVAPAVGMVTAPGQSFGELFDLSTLILAARVPEHELVRLRTGMRAEVGFPTTLETVEPLTVAGTLVSIVPETDTTSRRGTVEIEIEGSVGRGPAANGDGHPEFLPAGLFARARIHVEEIASAVWVDRRHFTWIGGRAVGYVLVADENGHHAERRELSFQRELGEGFVVTSGLRAGDALITRPLDRLEDGARCVLRDDGAPTEQEEEDER